MILRVIVFLLKIFGYWFQEGGFIAFRLLYSVLVCKASADWLCRIKDRLKIALLGYCFCEIGSYVCLETSEFGARSAGRNVQRGDFKSCFAICAAGGNPESFDRPIGVSDLKSQLERFDVGAGLGID
jgi:hypothetical protein